MPNKSENVNDFSELISVFHKLRNNNSGKWIFRGQANHEWKLLPKLGRANNERVRYKNMINDWTHYASIYLESPLKTRSEDYEIQSLALAQHHGLATVLLDWSYNPLVATYFSIVEQFGSDSIIYCYLTADSPKRSDKEYQDALKSDVGLGRFILLEPKPMSQRVIRQSGLFTYHQDPGKDFTEVLGASDEFVTIKIKNESKKDMLGMLDFLGISADSLFPGLDGVSKMLNARYNY